MTTTDTTTDNPAAPELEPWPFSSFEWLSQADARKWCDALASGYVSGKDVPAHRCPYARLLDRYRVSNCSPILPGPVHVVGKESQPLDASHWAKPEEYEAGELVTLTFFLRATKAPEGGWDERKIIMTLETIFLDMQRMQGYKAGNVVVTPVWHEGQARWQARMALVRDDSPCRG
jgi:hypothetical protein